MKPQDTVPAAFAALTGSFSTLAVGMGVVGLFAGATAWSVRQWVTA